MTDGSVGDMVGGLAALSAVSPLAQAAGIIVATFILEDAATVAAAFHAATGGIPIWLALGALYVGIILGDVGLYGLGRVAAVNPWLERRLPMRRRRPGRKMLENHLVKTVAAARFMPGARLPTYTACGFLRVRFWRFLLVAVPATLCWTTLLFWVAATLGSEILAALGPWRWPAAIAMVLGMLLIAQLTARRRGGVGWPKLGRKRQHDGAQ